MSDCRFGVSPVNYPDPDPELTLSNLISVYWECLTFYEGPWANLTHYTDG